MDEREGSEQSSKWSICLPMFKREEYGRMESQTKCNDTTGENIQNTSGKKGAKAPQQGRYKLSDLHRLTFKLEELDQVLDAETCTAEQFDAFADAVAETEDVDISIWPLEERRDLINEVYDFCLTEGYEFPLTEIADKAAQEGA
jgi:hypothetical protein